MNGSITNFHELGLGVTRGKEWEWAGEGREDWRFLKPPYGRKEWKKKQVGFAVDTSGSGEKILMKNRIVTLPEIPTVISHWQTELETAWEKSIISMIKDREGPMTCMKARNQGIGKPY